MTFLVSSRLCLWLPVPGPEGNRNGKSAEKPAKDAYFTLDTHGHVSYNMKM